MTADPGRCPVAYCRGRAGHDELHDIRPCTPKCGPIQPGLGRVHATGCPNAGFDNGPTVPADRQLDREEEAAAALAGYEELQRELLDTKRRLDEAIRALRVLGDAVRAVAGSRDAAPGLQSVSSLAALHVDQVLLELER